jgi:hypothetical protein
MDDGNSSMCRSPVPVAYHNFGGWESSRGRVKALSVAVSVSDAVDANVEKNAIERYAA